MRDKLMMAALLTAVGGLSTPAESRRTIIRRTDDWPPRGYSQSPVNTGRRAEKQSNAWAKAQAKRERKAAKRLAGEAAALATEQAKAARRTARNTPPPPSKP